MNSNTGVPIWERYSLTVEEASQYFRIGEKSCEELQKKIKIQIG